MSHVHSTLLEVKQLAFERNYETLFSDLSFTIHPGELLQIKGANGSGKSTLLRVIAGFLEPHQGKILWQNLSIYEEPRLYQQQLSYLGHQAGIRYNLTVYENIRLSLALAGGIRTHGEIESAADAVGLLHLFYNPAQFLSAGQLRRLGIAKLLLNPTPLWILDEPTTALDKEGQLLLLNTLETHLDAGGMAIISTHTDLNFSKSTKTILLGDQYG